MKSLFDGFNWNSVRIINAFNVTSPVSGTYIKSFGDTEYYQIGIKFNGGTEIYYNDKRLDFSAGSILYLPKEKTPCVPYNKMVLEKGSGVCIFFDSENSLPDEPKLFKYDSQKVEKLFARISKEYKETHGEMSFDVLSTFYKILSFLKNNEETAEINTKKRTRLNPATKYINEHFCDSFIDIEFLAESCGMTKEYFRHCFKNEFGASPLQYIAKMKVNKIKELLCGNNLSMTDISELTGFTEINYFSRFFKKQAGISPSEYKRQYGNIF